MRKMVQERRQRLAAETQSKEKDEMPPEKCPEPHQEKAESRGKWAEPREPPQLAQQADVTVTLGDGG